MLAAIPSSRFLSTLFTCGVGLTLLTETRAAVSLGTVPTYDAAGAGTVNFNSSGNALDSALLNDVAGFTTAVAAASGSNTGGVINFGTTGSTDVGQLDITYGGAKKFTITSSITYAAGAAATSQSFDIRANLSTLTPISGNTALLPTQAAGATAWGLNFGPITDGLAGEVITTAGFTLLSRSGTGQTVTVNWFLNGSTTAAFSDSEVIDASNNTDNTFFSYSAPTGSAITGFQINFGSTGPTADRRLGIDDLGFITGVIPEPSSVMLLGIAGLGMIARRRRN